MPAPPGILERADASKVKVFENQDEFDRDKGTFFGTKTSKSFVVKDPPRLKAVLQEASVKCSNGVYKVQLPSLAVYKSSGRSMVPFQTERKDKITEVLNIFSDDVTSSILSFKNSFVVATNQLSIWICSHDMVSASVERNCIGNIRCQVTGKRQVLVISWRGVLLAAKAHSMTAAPKEPIADFGKRVCEAMTAADMDCAGIKSEIVYREMQPGDLMCVPPGNFTIERTVPVNPPSDGNWTAPLKQENMVMGLRVHYLTGKDTESFEISKEFVKAQADQNISSDAAVKYWQHIRDGIESA